MLIGKHVRPNPNVFLFKFSKGQFATVTRVTILGLLIQSMPAADRQLPIPTSALHCPHFLFAQYS